MMNDKPKYFQVVTGFLAAVTILVSCLHSNSITGKWQETRGMQVGGKFNLDGQGNIRFEIQHEESNIEIIDAKVTFAEDELIFKFGDTGEVERYRKVEP
jgi:hypothetical protein